MDDLKKRIAALSPEQRALFERQLKQKNLQWFSKQTIPRRKDSNSLPLSFAQQRLWFLDQMEPDNPSYNIPIAWHFTGRLNVATLLESLNEIVRRHESLRTTFACVEGKPSQVIAPVLNLALPVVNLQELPETKRNVAQQLATAEAKRPFNLAQGPLLRVTLLQLSEEEHVFLLTIHHIIADGWSRGVLLRELAVLYKAFSTGKPSLPELPIQYVDFAIWQRQWLQGKELEIQLSYWKQQLDNLPILELPTDRPRPAVQNFRGATQTFILPTDLVEALKALSRQEGVTLFMTLLAAFKILLHGYTSQDDIVVGSPIANRNWAETEGLIGFFVNTLVLRTNLSGNPTFRELLKRVREVTSGAYKHQDLPFAKLVEKLQPERNLCHNPLFQVMFQLQNEAYQFQNSLMPALELPGLTLSQVWVDTESTKFDLSWHLVERAEGLLGVVEYSTELFIGDTITRMLGHFQVLLEGIVANPQANLSELPVLTETERYQVLVKWNNTLDDSTIVQCIHKLFEVQAELSPDAIAVVFQDEHLTYRELNRKANQLAHHLQTLSVGPEVLVGICVERSLLMVVGLLGILKAGGAYVPLDPAYPKQRLATMIADAQVSVLLTQEKLVTGLPDGAHVVCLDKDWRGISQEDGNNPLSAVTGENLAYVIYTSGSTGKPKGTMLPHKGLVNYLLWCTKAYAVADGCGAPVQSSIGFDATITSLYSPLLGGQKVVLLPEKQEIEALSAALTCKNNFSLVKLTPAHLQMLSQVLPTKEDGCQTKALIIGGEALSGKSLSFWHTYDPNTKLINEYGPTETVVGCCVYEVPAQNTSLSSTVPIGRPIANTQLYILNKYLQPVAIGVRGELHIGGAGLAWGYLNCPELTAEKFIPNPFSDAGTRLYKTGDLARYLPDGNIEYLGRLDNQVKIRGFRIELGEIEAVLAQHPEVQASVVIAREDNPGDKRLVAYVVLSSAHPSISSSQLRRFLQEKLPDYMVPAAFVMLSALPLTPNGKVDRKALPAPDSSQRYLEVGFVSPRTPNEKVLAAIWAEVLGKKQVGIQDNFFELGGDSILSIQIIARANQVGLQLTPRQLFQHQTIAELATVAGTSPVQTEQGLVTGSVALTPIQHWFFEQNIPEPDQYNQSVLLEVAALKPHLLKRVVQQLLVHHDALRLRFVRNESTWQQVNTAPDEKVPFTVVDLSEFSDGEQQPVIEAAAANLQASLNLSEGPIMQAVLFHLDRDKSGRLLLIIHHLAVDGVSWRILLEDLSVAYQQLDRGEAIQLPPKTTSFKDWANRLSFFGQSQALAAELDYWLAESRSSVAPLPVDYPSGKENNTVASAAQVLVSLNVEQTRALLEELPHTYHTQINDVLLTALVQSFAQWTGSSSLLVNLEGHGREELFEVDLSRTVGWFTTIFPVLLELSEISHPGEALKSVKEQLRRIPNRGIGYGILRYLSQDTAIPLKLQVPQAEVIFNYLGQLDRVMSGSSEYFNTTLLGLAKKSNGLHSLSGRRHLLEVNGFIAEGRLQLNWTYSKNVHQRSTVERLAQNFIEALKTLITHCQSPEAGGYTPSDFSAARLNQKQLDKFIAKIGETVPKGKLE